MGRSAGRGARPRVRGVWGARGGRRGSQAALSRPRGPSPPPPGRTAHCPRQGAEPRVVPARGARPLPGCPKRAAAVPEVGAPPPSPPPPLSGRSRSAGKGRLRLALLGPGGASAPRGAGVEGEKGRAVPSFLGGSLRSWRRGDPERHPSPPGRLGTAPGAGPPRSGRCFSRSSASRPRPRQPLGVPSPHPASRAPARAPAFTAELNAHHEAQRNLAGPPLIS